MFWIVTYLIGVVLALYALIKRVIMLQNELTVVDIFYSSLISLGSWISWLIFSDFAGNILLELGRRLFKTGEKTLWKKTTTTSAIPK